MGMICYLHAVNADDLARITVDPDTLGEVEHASSIRLEKSWHGLHYVLTGTAWEGTFPLSLILGGGTVLEDADMGYGPARALSPEEVITASNALDAIDEKEFDRRFVLEEMAGLDLYPSIWDEPREELLDEYLTYFQALQLFLRQTARARMGVIVYLS